MKTKEPYNKYREMWLNSNEGIRELEQKCATLERKIADAVAALQAAQGIFNEPSYFVDFSDEYLKGWSDARVKFATALQKHIAAAGTTEGKG